MEEKIMKCKALTLVFSVIVFLFGMGNLSGAAAAETIDLKFSSPWPPQHPQHTMVILPWAQKINELSGGRVKVTLFPGEALGKAADHYDMAAKGICDIALTNPMYTPGRFHLLSAFWLPFMVTTAENTSVALWKTYEKYFQNEFKDVKVLWMYVHAPGQIFTREKPIKTSGDLKGMKIRATNPSVQESLKLLGASPVAIPVPDVYNALERGVVDGTAMPFEGLYVFKQHEVVKYGVICDLYTMTFPIVMNKAKFESLPPDIQKIIDDTTGLEISRKAGNVYDKAEASMKQKVLDYGVKVNNLPPKDLADWRLKGQKIRDQWIKETTSEGAPGAAIIKEIDTELGFQ
jgi:TRAP-type C4-dicarboxylate transport system substrate-binding protein